MKKDSYVEMHEFSTLAPNVVLSAGSDDYIAGIATPMIPMEDKIPITNLRLDVFFILVLV